MYYKPLAHNATGIQGYTIVFLRSLKLMAFSPQVEASTKT